MDSFLILASQDPSLLTTILTVTKTILLVLIGVNMLIIVHEWGHFMVARMCGVKCEKFYIWFDIFGWKLFKFRWGETEFGLGVLPLGGYVKMLGQEDNPGRLREELERAKAAEAAKADDSEAAGDKPAEAVDIKAAEAALYDPESYLSKSVPQRMAIISAGVIMNVIFAFIVAVIAYGMGVYKVDSRIGMIAPGGAAWRADMRVGDRVVEVSGKPITQFDKLREATMLGNLEEGLPIIVQRPGVDHPVEITAHPDRDLGVPTIGIGGPATPTLDDEQPTQFGTPAYRAQPDFEPGDTIVAVNGEEIDAGYEFHRAQAVGRDAPMEVTVLRSGGKSEADERETVEVGVRPMRRFGLVMTAGPIRNVQDNSPAEAAGITPGDRILAIDGEPLGDPLTLETRLSRRVDAAPQGETVSVELQLEGREEPLTVPLRPVDWYEIPIYGLEHPSVPSLGITIELTPRVADVIDGSPADAAGVRTGDTVKAITPIPPDSEDRERYDIPKRLKQPKATIDLTDDKASWTGVFYLSLQDWLPGTDVDLELETGRTVRLDWYEDQGWNHPQRGFRFQPQETFVEAQSIGEAVTYGLEEARNALMMVFKFIGKVSSQQISPRMMGGPWTIVKIAYHYASSRFTDLLLFLCAISANLAVINFLPIPVLDGGHMVFLAYEGVRGKPPSENVQVGLSYVGLLLLLSLMVWVFGLDLGFIPR